MAKTSRRKSATRRTRALRRVATRRVARPSVRAIELTLADLAHDIRTPLTGILALGELLASSELKPREREWATARSRALPSIWRC